MRTFVSAVIALSCLLAVGVEAFQFYRPITFNNRSEECLRKLTLTETDIEDVESFFLDWKQNVLYIPGFNSGKFHQYWECLTYYQITRWRECLKDRIPPHGETVDYQTVDSVILLYEEFISKVTGTGGNVTYERVLNCLYKNRDPADAIGVEPYKAYEIYRPVLFDKSGKECLVRDLTLTENEIKKVDDHFFGWIQKSFDIVGFDAAKFQLLRECLTYDRAPGEKMSCLPNVRRWPEPLLDDQTVETLWSVYEYLRSEVDATVWEKATYDGVLECFYDRDPTDFTNYQVLSPEDVCCVNATLHDDDIPDNEHSLYFFDKALSDMEMELGFFRNKHGENGTKALECLLPDTLVDKAKIATGDRFAGNRTCLNKYLKKSAIKNLEGMPWRLFRWANRNTDRPKTLLGCAQK